MFYRRVAFFLLLLSAVLSGRAQENISLADTIPLGAITEGGITYPVIFLPEHDVVALAMDQDEKHRRAKLMRDIHVTYPYALTAASILNSVYVELDKKDRRRDRKKYLKSVSRQLDAVFKEPLKNLTIDQGHVLIKLINRQTGQNCYSIIKDLKGGVSAVVWQGVGVLFNNNLSREYDPEDRDREVEAIVRELEASAQYRYHLYRQDELLKKAALQ